MYACVNLAVMVFCITPTQLDSVSFRLAFTMLDSHSDPQEPCAPPEWKHCTPKPPLAVHVELLSDSAARQSQPLTQHLPKPHVRMHVCHCACRPTHTAMISCIHGGTVPDVHMHVRVGLAKTIRPRRGWTLS